MEFAADYADSNFVMGQGINQHIYVHCRRKSTLFDAVAKSARDAGAFVLCMVVTGETDEIA